MSDSQGFEVDLTELDALANTNVPFIEQTCSDAETTLKTNAQQDATIFDETSGSNLYLDVQSTFVQTRSDLEYLLDSLTSSLGECATALREIHRRYAGADGESVTRFRTIGAAS